jgi:GDP-L-fucose synthase
MKVLVTGGGAFIARHAAEQLTDVCDLVAPNRNDLDLLDAERVQDRLESGKFDVVVHAANYDAAPRNSTKDPAKVLENNLKMFFHLVRCKDHFGKMLYFGSGAEYDRDHWVPRMKEDQFGRHVPADPYGLSKYVMNQVARSSDTIYNLRLFGVFGPHDDWRTRFIPNACGHAVLGLPIRIDQDRRLDFIHIDDLIRILRWFIHHRPRRHDYNVCSGTAMDFRRIADLLTGLSGKSPGVEIIRPGSGREYSGDNTLLMDEMGGFVFRPFEPSLNDLYAWYEAHKSILRKEDL